MSRTSAQHLADALLELATHAYPVDLPAFLAVLTSRSTQLLQGCAAAALTAPTHAGGVQVSGSPSAVHHLTLDAAARGEGPGQDCVRSGTPLRPTPFDSPAAKQRWPHYTARARRLGYSHAAALPLRARSQNLGALVLLSPRLDRLNADNLATAGSLARMAAYTLHHERSARESATRLDQLEHALTSRVLIEQAKGVLAARRSLPMDEAFALLRGRARAQQRLLSDVAREVVEGHSDLTDV